ncbi:MAG: 2-oxoacid:acceptor oxidoreductase subunit alpha [Planctomycetota bacterium]
MDTVTSPNVRREDRPKPVQELLQAAVRFAGDSGDGMQLVGSQFTATSAVFGNDVATFPDYPAEIRAPMGTLAGVSGFQINISSREIHTPGDRVNALVAMNPAALKVNIADLIEGGVLVVNSEEFTPGALEKAQYKENPLETGELKRYQVYAIPITSQTLEAVKETGLGPKDAGRCKNFYALGILYWLYDRPLEPTVRWINSKFGKVPAVARANLLALQAGHHFGEIADMFTQRYHVKPAALRPGVYRNLTGNQATALGFITAAKLAGRPLFYGSYPITPASEILHELAERKDFDVRVFQAEDEIAAMCSVVGAAFAGALAVTGTSGPGMALKQEAIGLAVITELPCVIVNVQRGGPSTGLPTKPEQADLWQAILGRNGECPLPVLAARSPSDCFWAALEATQIALKYMTPVILLTDGYIAQGSEPWRVPDEDELPQIKINFHTDPRNFQPYARDAHGARPWAIPGTKGLHHRIGGLEKAHLTGNVSHNPENHQLMVANRAKKVADVLQDVPDQDLYGADSGDLLVVSWGGTFGAVRTAVEHLRENGRTNVSHAHLRWLNPMPRNLGDVLRRFKRLLVCELNMGQLEFLLRGRYLVETAGLHKVQGRPFMVHEIVERVDALLDGK